MLHSSYLSAPYLLVSNTEAIHRIPLTQITHLSAHNSSTEIRTIDQQRLVSAKPIHLYENLLVNQGFLRIHQSTLINLYHLRAVIKQEGTSYATLTSGEKLPIARTQKTKLLHHLKTHSINHEPYKKTI